MLLFIITYLIVTWSYHNNSVFLDLKYFQIAKFACFVTKRKV